MSEKKSLINFRKSALVLTVLAIIAIMLIPIPALLLDILIALNLFLSFVVLFIVIHNKKPGEFSLFPTVLLALTVFGLAINLSAARLILVKGEYIDSWIIRTVSSIVAGSGETAHLVIGSILFIAALAVQVLVIAKGTVRVSEVAARFALNACPAKYMSIDAEYSSGTINEKEAAYRKETVQRENDFLGAMDGASRFVSGNIKIGILVISVIILGGILIGTKFNDNTMIEAVKIYVPLGIGYGIISMLPALILCTTIGITITRTIGNQKKEAAINRKKKTTEPLDTLSTKPINILSLELGLGLIPLVDKDKGAELLERIQGMRRQINQDMGIVIPKIRVIDNMLLGSREYSIKIRGVEAGKYSIRMGNYLCINPGTVKKELTGERTKEPAFGLPAIWITKDRRDEAELSGYTVVDPDSIIITHFTEIIRSHAEELSRENTVETVGVITPEQNK